jgi:adenosylcobinamide-phosphate synthase
VGLPGGQHRGLYRDARYERFGKAAARLDDAANLVPARVAAVALAVGAAMAGEDGVGAARLAWRDHARTASPNAGWPMAAMAGALGVGLAKPGAYRLGDGALPRDRSAIVRAVRVFGAASALVIGAALALTLARRRRG